MAAPVSTGAKSGAANPLNEPSAPTRMVVAVTPSVSPAWDTVSTVTLPQPADHRRDEETRRRQSDGRSGCPPPAGDAVAPVSTSTP